MSSDDILMQTAVELVRMDENGVTAREIRHIFGLGDDEITMVRESPAYAEALSRFVAARTRMLVTAKETHQSIVSRALKNVNIALIDNHQDGDFALRSLVVAQRLKDKLNEGDQNLRNLNTPEGMITLQLPVSVLASLRGVSAERLTSQDAQQLAGGKDVGMIGAEKLKSFMTIEHDAAPAAKVVETFDFNSLL